VLQPEVHVSRASLFEKLTLAQDQHLIAFRWIILTAFTDSITAQYAYKVNCNTRNLSCPDGKITCTGEQRTARHWGTERGSGNADPPAGQEDPLNRHGVRPEFGRASAQGDRRR
jgi:hypothetical protein